MPKYNRDVVDRNWVGKCWSIPLTPHYRCSFTTIRVNSVVSTLMSQCNTVNERNTAGVRLML